MAKKKTPWDIYVDEIKNPHYKLGFLVVPNSASFMHRLWKLRISNGRTCSREIHWNKPSMDTLGVALKWVDEFFRFNGAKFYLLDWKQHQTKASVVIKFLDKLTESKKTIPPHNMVVFLDFDCEHSKVNIQNSVRETADIARCYHLDSLNNDCLQCCDLLLNSTLKQVIDPTVRFDLEGLQAKYDSRQRLKDSEVKRYLAGYVAKQIDSVGKKVYYSSRRIQSPISKIR
ncbi:MAG: hypothetical protein JKX85_01485 [Phycisphaeraceae bacterium]|nr:hypothetical protein [Phycisphaeraceae bacterium]